MTRYEYVAVRIQQGLDEEKATERLNSVSAHGWRMISTYASGTVAMAIFERELDDDAGRRPAMG